MSAAHGEEEEAGEEPFATVKWSRMARFVARLLGKHPWLLTGSFVAAIGVAASDILSISLLFPFIQSLGGNTPLPEGLPLSFMTDYFASMTLETKIRTIAVLLVVIQLARGVLSYAESRMTGYLGVLFERDLRQMVFDDLLRVELRFIHREKTANLFTIMHSYPKESARLVRDYLGVMSKSITAIVLLVILLQASWQLTLLALGLGLVSLLAVSQLRRVAKRLGRQIAQSRVRLHQASLESLQSMKLIRLYAREDHASARFGKEVHALQRQTFGATSVGAAAGPLQRILNTSLFAALLIAATFVLQETGEGWLLLLTAFLLIMARLMSPLANFATRGARIAAETPAMEAVIDFLERPKPYLKEGTRAFDHLRAGIRFEDVSFRYADDGPLVLDKIHFDIPRGSTVALVGESGSGKSTMVQLVSRLSDPSSGRITVDGVDLREFQSATWRRRVAVVSQDVSLFNDTARNNIRFGRLDATDAEVEQAAKLANAHDFILAMENGYDTLVGDRGVRLSGGQAQRIAIARAILADPELLILDEATSALDTATERQVQDALETLSRSRTLLVVAHRLSTIRHANTILVLDQGRIVERGTHDELMAKGGRYATLVRMQDLGEAPPPRRDAAPRSVAVEAPPARPARVVLAPEGPARVVLDDGTTREVAVAMAQEEDAPPVRGDVVLLRVGETNAAVRLGLHMHGDVPLYHVGSSGTEVRTRVREMRVGPGGASRSPRVRLLP